MLGNKKFKLFLLAFLLFIFGPPNLVFALEINYPSLPGATPPQDFLQTASPEQILPLYVLYIFNLAIWISGIIALGVIVYAGVLYLTSAGKPEVIISARNQISSAFLGILLLLSSFLILRVLNTQLVILEMPEPEPIEVVERPETPQPPTELHRSSINVEIPFANMIEKRIFESYVPPGETRKPRMTRIKENASTTLQIANDLVELNNALDEETEKCKCYDNTVPNPRCSGSCSNCPPDECTCDPCEDVRDDIEDKQEEILEKLDELKAEEEKLIVEIRNLKTELNRLERAGEFMKDCPLSRLNSLAEFLDTKKFYLSEKWLFLDIKFWEEIITIEDWASFYCPVSGTIWGLEQYYTPSEEMMEEPSPLEISEEAQEAMACTIEVPVGEIIDRAKRIGYKLAEKLETLSVKNKEMATAVDEMQVLVSQCSSERCFPVCFCVKKKCIEVGCFGLPCPYWEIKNQVKKIEQIQKEIERLVKGGEEEEMETISSSSEVKDLNLSQKQAIYEDCGEEYERIVAAIREGWIDYSSSYTDCVCSYYGDQQTCECQWKGNADGLKNYVENYVESKIEEDVLKNWEGYYCDVFEKKLSLERVNEFVNCLEKSYCDISCSTACETCYDNLETQYEYYDLRPCVGTCVEEKIKKELFELQPETTVQEIEEEIGIIPIIAQVVPKIIEDLNKEVRKHMKECIYETSPEATEELPSVLLSDCESALRAVGPKGKIIENCCLDEPEFQKCLDSCYLEEGQEKYKKCLEDCLISESQNLKNEGKTRESEIIATCRHKINFYCCGK